MTRQYVSSMLWVLAALAFFSIPAVWTYLSIENFSSDDFSSHPVGPYAPYAWPWSFSFFSQLALFLHMAGTGTWRILKPVFILHLFIVIPFALFKIVVFIFFLAMGDWLWLMLPAYLLYFYGAYRMGRWIIRRWFSELLDWRDTPKQRIYIAAVTALPVIMSVVGMMNHIDSLYTFP